MSVESIMIQDPEGTTSADVLVGFGFNCYRLQTIIRGQKIDVLWSEPGFETGRKRASGSGIPILFPFPGRIKGTQFHWNNQSYPLEEGDGCGNAIHGFVHTRPWRLVDRGSDFVTAEFQASIDDPSLRTQWPSDFYLRATYRISKACLASHFEVENRGDEPLPIGLGTHPYFRLPLRSDSNAEDCRVQVPVSSSWELVEMNATGKCLPLSDALAYQTGLRFGDVRFDNVFSGLTGPESPCEAQLHDSSPGCSVRIRWSDEFRELVVYTPPHREAICIEPYTCVPDAFRLAKQNIDAGARVLEPGASFEAFVDMLITDS
ncbi:MAG: aldose 1-epimerase [Planctomycetaceae bacterium]|nr:aldose 1-epimerase [Planctomycetaceae bacterium]